MQPAADTSSEAHAVHIKLYRAFTPEKRLLMGLKMADDGRELAKAGIRSRHPDYSEAQIEDALRVIYLGESMFRRVWPGRSLVSP